MEIVEFLTARLDEDATGHLPEKPFPDEPFQCARCEGRWGYPFPVPVAVEWPCRPHLEVEAMRRIVERHSPRVDYLDRVTDSCQYDGATMPCLDLLDLASVYVDHPDYREEWRP